MRSKAVEAVKAQFLRMREKLPIEKITVEALCRQADVNRSTFYRHFADVYALERAMEEELLQFWAEKLLEDRSIYDDIRAFFRKFDEIMNQGESRKRKECLFRSDYNRMMRSLAAVLSRKMLDSSAYSLEEYVKYSYIFNGSFGVCMSFYNEGGIENTDEVYELIARQTEKLLQ